MPKIIIKRDAEILDEKLFTEDVEIISIGRSSLNHIQLPDPDAGRPKISRFHAAIVKNKHARYFVRDLSSKNGTRLNGSLIYRKILKDADQIQIGNINLLFRESAEGKETVNIRYLSEKEERKWFKHRCGVDSGTVVPTSYGSIYISPKELKGIQSNLGIFYKGLLEDIYNVIKSASDPSSLFKEILNTLIHVLNAQKGYALQLSNGEPLPIAFKGFDSELSLPFFKSMQKIALDQGEIFISEADLILGIPLKKEDDILGLLYLEKNNGFSRQEIYFVRVLADYFAKHVTHLPQPISKNGHAENIAPSKNFLWRSEIIGNKPTIFQMNEKITAAAVTNDNVLILGETRTGKELVARAIHKESLRKGEFIEINVSAHPETWFEDVLLGREDRVAHGAKAKKGVFELADGGTLFFDEIGDLRVDYQSKLLKLFETRTITRLGGERPVSVDVKIVAATNKDLKQGIREGWFREDLYYRFAHIVDIPPLKNRKEDIPLLAHYFLDRYSDKYSAKAQAISHNAIRQLMDYSWPGNIGELENCIIRAVSKNKDKIVLFLDGINLSIQQTPESLETECEKIEKHIDRVECEEIRKVLKAANWNASEAAKRLGMSHAGIYLKMKKYGIRRVH